MKMNNTSEVTVDPLWKYQLRREHAALLEEMQVQGDAFKSFSEETKTAHQRFQEELASLASKCDKLIGENDKRSQEIRNGLRNVQERSDEIEKIRADLKAIWNSIHAAKGVESGEVDAILPPATIVSTKTPVKSSTEPPFKGSNTVPSQLPQNSPPSTTKPSQNVANTGLRKSRRQARQEPSPVGTHTYGILPEQPLDQGGIKLDDFVLQVDNISNTVSPTDLKPLAAMFISGLSEREEQDAIVKELSKKGLSKIYGKGQVEIKCDWADVKKVLVMLKMIGGEGEGRARKRRKK